MRILTIIALAAMTFGFASCAKKQTTTTSSGGKTVVHGHGYKK